MKPSSFGPRLSPTVKHALPSLCLALIAFCVAAARIDPGLMPSNLPAGPGLTPDESFNILQGYYLADALLEHGPLLWTPAKAQQVFGDPNYLPDHPPLGRLWLGLSHEFTSGFFSGADSALANVAAARLGSCFLFSLTVMLLSEFCCRRFDVRTAVLAAVCLMLMPRVVGHARLASLETATSLTWLLACVPLWSWWTSDQPPNLPRCLISGLMFGLLLLTKVQGILLPPLVVLWALYRFRHSAMVPLLSWGLTAALVFLMGWPWLWLDPFDHVLTYLGRAAERDTLYVWYFGLRYADKQVPWHYPFVMTAITVPLIVLAAAAWQMASRRMQRMEWLIAGSVAWPLIVFAAPGTPVYDGTRLFLIVMPAVAILAARGFLYGVEVVRQQRRWVRLSAITLCVLLTLPPLSQTFSPFAISSYSLLIGQQSGARSVGMEASYWLEGWNGSFWNDVPEGSTVYVAPISHQFQLQDLQTLVPIVSQRKIRFEPFDYDPQQQRGLVLLNHRLADLPPALREVPAGATVIAEVRYGGTVLTRIVDTSDATWATPATWPAAALADADSSSQDAAARAD